jgi:hypothetical protein
MKRYMNIKSRMGLVIYDEMQLKKNFKNCHGDDYMLWNEIFNINSKLHIELLKNNVSVNNICL